MRFSVCAILLACSAYFYAVSVNEMWYSDGLWRPQGGWTHSGPFKTLDACERARASEKTRAYEGHVVRYDAHACRLVDFDRLVNELRNR